MLLKIALESGVDLAYRDDDFTPPWEEPETALLLHATAENSLAWHGWVPRLASRMRVVRPDLRGFGGSTPMPRDHAWSLDRLAADVLRLADRLDVARVHLVAAETAGPIALRIAAGKPDRVASLILLGSHANPAAGMGERYTAWREHLTKQGVESWAGWTMTHRLGADQDPAMREGWTAMMARAPAPSVQGFVAALPAFDATGDLGAIACPTLVVTTDGNPLTRLEVTAAWQRLIANSELMVMAGDAFHVAATHAKDCASAAQDFWKKHAKEGRAKGRQGGDDKEAKRTKRRERKAA